MANVNSNVVELRKMVGQLATFEGLFRAATATTLATGKSTPPKYIPEGEDKETVLKSATVFFLASQAGDLCITAGKLPKEINAGAILRRIMASQVAALEFDMTAAVPKTEEAATKAADKAVLAKAQRDAIPTLFASRRGK